jgi:hypothetical protein
MQITTSASFVAETPAESSHSKGAQSSCDVKVIFQQEGTPVYTSAKMIVAQSAARTTAQLTCLWLPPNISFLAIDP